MGIKKTITRYAPSPTGKPHVGNIRTALFSYLWARHNNGEFLLRIEDTDRERLVQGAQQNIEESLSWLDLNYDRETIFQSDRREIHLKFAEKLLATGKAYKCFCTKGRLEELRKQQEIQKVPPGYDKHCRNLSKEELAEKENAKEKYVIRFAMPEKGEAVWDDAVRGKMRIEYAISDDPVIIKSDGWPTYHLASVVDDHEFEITDIIRGEEWIPSTPKHIALYEAFGWEKPCFAHMPHINGPDGTKLSKRHGDTALLDYRELGYLPEAMTNFLALLGWNDKTDKELFTEAELIKVFDVKNIGKSPAVFDLKKLDWINGQYIRQKDDQELLAYYQELYPGNKLVGNPLFPKILAVEKDRLSKLADIFTGTEYFTVSPKYQPGLLVFRKGTKEKAKAGLITTEKLLTDSNWEKASVSDFEDILKKAVADGLTNGDVFWPVRVALCGLENSPSPAELLWVLGKNESLARLKKAIDSL